MSTESNTLTIPDTMSIVTDAVDSANASENNVPANDVPTNEPFSPDSSNAPSSSMTMLMQASGPPSWIWFVVGIVLVLLVALIIGAVVWGFCRDVDDGSDTGRTRRREDNVSKDFLSRELDEISLPDSSGAPKMHLEYLETGSSLDGPAYDRAPTMISDSSGGSTAGPLTAITAPKEELPLEYDVAPQLDDGDANLTVAIEGTNYSAVPEEMTGDSKRRHKRRSRKHSAKGSGGAGKDLGYVHLPSDVFKD